MNADDRDRMPPERNERTDDERQPSPPYPGLLKTAGIIWIVFGSVILLNGALALANTREVGNETARVVSGSCSIIFIAFIGGVFIHVGVQSIGGTARDVMGNGIGSLVFALLYAGNAVLWMDVYAVVAIIGFLACAALAVAGIMAIVSRTDYMDWRKVNKPKGPSSDKYFGRDRRRDDDRDAPRHRRDYDDRDDRDEDERRRRD